MGANHKSLKAPGKLGLWTKGDAVSAASIGLIAVVALRLAQDTLIDWRGWLVALAAGAVLWRWKVAPAWLVLAGAVAGRVLWR